MVISKDIRVERVERYVKAFMAKYDSSHDWLHVQRVRAMAHKIGSSLNNVDLELVDLAALLHDVGDAKYGPEESVATIIANLLEEVGFSKAFIDKVCFIVENVSFRKELALIEKGEANSIYENNLELCCVQDADRLDAIGAIGIARCMAFSGAKNIPIYDPDVSPIDGLTASLYNIQTTSRQGTAVNHFYEKLFLLPDLMKTELGKNIAKDRTILMKDFVANITEECTFSPLS